MEMPWCINDIDDVYSALMRPSGTYMYIVHSGKINQSKRLKMNIKHCEHFQQVGATHCLQTSNTRNIKWYKYFYKYAQNIS